MRIHLYIHTMSINALLKGHKVSVVKKTNDMMPITHIDVDPKEYEVTIDEIEQRIMYVQKRRVKTEKEIFGPEPGM
ncbi:hypothetical protein D3C79_613650 [compost metagenome]